MKRFLFGLAFCDRGVDPVDSLPICRQVQNLAVVLDLGVKFVALCTHGISSKQGMPD
jgi:hypothetical protein